MSNPRTLALPWRRTRRTATAPGLRPAKKDEFRVPVDGRLVVTETRDGGATFASLSRGLPQGEAHDLIYRHALVIDRTGTRLAMGSTTGGLWVSPDQGASWQLLSAHLPPISCLAFAP